MINQKKPHKGSITNWQRYYNERCQGLGYLIRGRFVDHPEFACERGHTSWVLKHNLETGEIETRNSRYTLIGPECPRLT